MHNDKGHLVDVNLNALRICESGRSILAELSDFYAPHQPISILFKNVYNFRMSRSADVELPYFILELHWERSAPAENRNVLSLAQYSIKNELGDPLVVNHSFCVCEFEGELCGQIIAADVICEGESAH